MQAVHGGRDQTRRQFRKGLRRKETPARGISECSGGDTESEGDTTDGYTSGALASDDHIGHTTSRQDVEFDSNSASADTVTATRDARDLPSTGRAFAPSPCYSEGDYEPLCTVCPQAKNQQTILSHPRKRRKLMSRPGKVMKLAYFKEIQWS